VVDRRNKVVAVAFDTNDSAQNVWLGLQDVRHVKSERIVKLS
jgi:hypothetical protein